MKRKSIRPYCLITIRVTMKMSILLQFLNSFQCILLLLVPQQIECQFHGIFFVHYIVFSLLDLAVQIRKRKNYSLIDADSLVCCYFYEFQGWSSMPHFFVTQNRFKLNRVHLVFFPSLSISESVLVCACVLVCLALVFALSRLAANCAEFRLLRKWFENDWKMISIQITSQQFISHDFHYSDCC